MNNVARWTVQWASGSGLGIEFLKETESTNSLARDKDFHERCLIVTEHQTAGRGRGTNQWFDVEPGSCLLSSWCFPMSQPMQPITSPLVGLALYEAVQTVWPQLGWSLKPPNDLYITNKKVAGLLIENVSMGASRHQLVIGLGFNVFSSPSIENAGSLQSFLRTPLAQDQWNRFLDLFSLNLQKTLPEGMHKTMSPSLCRRLLAALNNSPMLMLKYDEVRPDGSLRIGDKLISWMEL